MPGQGVTKISFDLLLIQIQVLKISASITMLAISNIKKGGDFTKTKITIIKKLQKKTQINVPNVVTNKRMIQVVRII